MRSHPSSFPLPSCVLGAALLLGAGLPSLAQAQDPGNPIVGRVQAYAFKSPTRGNPHGGQILVYEKILRSPNASFLQVSFSKIQLEEGSLLVVESLFDDAKQTWRPGQATEVGLDSVYFNGDALRVRLFAGPGTRRNSFSIRSLGIGLPQTQSIPLTLCGPDTRTPSTNRKVARLLLQKGQKIFVCTGFLISRVNCFATAGHCLSSTQVVTVQFDVPPSTSKGLLTNPPPSSQYLWEGNANSFRRFENAGKGKDWGVFTTFKNTVTQRYPGPDRGSYFKFASVPSKGQVQTFGYGADNTPLTRNKVQQRSSGPIQFRFPTSLAYRVSTQGGNSGGPITFGSSELVVAVHTHGGCDNNPKSFNLGTRQDYGPFVQARTALCNRPLRPDLRALSVGAPSFLQAGGTATFTSKISNVGTQSSPATTSAYVISKNRTISVTDRLLKTFTTRALGLGQVHNHSVFVPLPRDLEEGACYIGVIANSQNSFPEETRANNAIGAKRTCRGLPDLATLSVLSSRSRLSAGQFMAVTLSIQNRGKRASTRVNSGIYLSTDSLITQGDRLLASFSTPPLAPQARQDTKVAFRLPSSLPRGTCYIGVLADREGKLVEIDEGNNGRSKKVYCGPLPLPDLAATALRLSTTRWVPGGQVNLVSTTRNLNLQASSSTTNAYYLSKDQVLTTQDSLLLSFPLPMLKYGQSFQHSAKVKIPNGAPTGSCYLGVWADAVSKVAETRENNNTKVLPGTCVGVPDLEVVRVQVGKVGPGEIFAFHTAFKNTGNGSAQANRAGVLLSPDQRVDRQDLYLGTIFVPALGPGQTHSVTSLHRLPFSLSAGTHYLGAMVDVNDTISESNESNNIRAISIQTSAPYKGKGKAIEFLARYGTMAKSLKFATYSAKLGGNAKMVITAPSLKGSWYYCIWSRSPNFVFDDLSSLSISFVNTPLFQNWLGSIDSTGYARLGTSAPPGIQIPAAFSAYTHVFFFDAGFQNLLGGGDNYLQTLITK